ncbi:hypothetical protein CAter10_3563 [Collimonas arenae]|nr:hypothetical protein CAter10_3563 [Collimonas arenae]
MRRQYVSHQRQPRQVSDNKRATKSFALRSIGKKGRRPIGVGSQ